MSTRQDRRNVEKMNIEGRDKGYGRTWTDMDNGPYYVVKAGVRLAGITGMSIYQFSIVPMGRECTGRTGYPAINRWAIILCPYGT